MTAKRAAALEGMIDTSRRARPDLHDAEERVPTRRLSTNVDERTYLELRHFAADAQMTHQEILAEALREYLDSHKGRRG